jgi:phosphatidylinositol phospholipase C delta
MIGMLNSVTGRLQVEYYPPTTPGTGADEVDGSSTSSLLEENNDAESPTTERSKQKRPRISDSLAALGVYARSMKPRKDWVNQGIYPPSFADFIYESPG